MEAGEERQGERLQSYSDGSYLSICSWLLLLLGISDIISSGLVEFGGFAGIVVL